MANERVITRKDFESYERVRKSKKFNMLFSAAREATGLTEDQYYILRANYRKAKEVYETQPEKGVLLGRL